MKRKDTIDRASRKCKGATQRRPSAAARTLPLPGTRPLDQAAQLALPLALERPSRGEGHEGLDPPPATRPGRSADRGLRPASPSPSPSILAGLNLRAWLGPGSVDSQADPEKRLLYLAGRVCELGPSGLVIAVMTADAVTIPPPRVAELGAGTLSFWPENELSSPTSRAPASLRKIRLTTGREADPTGAGFRSGSRADRRANDRTDASETAPSTRVSRASTGIGKVRTR